MTPLGKPLAYVDKVLEEELKSHIAKIFPATGGVDVAISPASSEHVGGGEKCLHLDNIVFVEPR